MILKEKNNMEKLIIGITGEIASGKTTASDYIKQKYGAISFRFSDMLRDILDRVHVEKNRTNMQSLSTFLRGTYGEDIMSKVLAKDVELSDAKIIITEGIRRPTDVEYLKEIPGFILIAIDLDEKTRYERLTQRSENPDDQNKTFEQFQKECNQETERKIRESFKIADHIIENTGDFEEFYAKIEKIIGKYKANNS